MSKNKILRGVQGLLLFLLLFSVFSFLWLDNSTIVGDSGLLMEIYQEVHITGVEIILMLGVVWLEMLIKK